jgi:hypothetical protein
MNSEFEFDIIEELPSSPEKNISTVIIPIFRYKFTVRFMEELYEFSKIHQYDIRKDFKDAWTIWLQDNSDIINLEISRISQLGYNGNIIEKMYKSARYYFRKKTIVNKKESISRKPYISVSLDLLNAMDNHISDNIHIHSFQPKIGYELFIKNNELLINKCIENIITKGVIDTKWIQQKLKKTYKNRYFMFRSQNLTIN